MATAISTSGSSSVVWVTCCSLSAVSTLMMPAIETITAKRPRRPKPPASHVVGKIHSRPSAEPGAASCMSVIATMSIAGTTATHPNARRFQGMTIVAPVSTNDDHDADEEQRRIAGERTERDEHRDARTRPSPAAAG